MCGRSGSKLETERAVPKIAAVKLAGRKSQGGPLMKMALTNWTRVELDVRQIALPKPYVV